MSKEVIKICKNCNIEFNSCDKRRKFCSKSCSSIYNNKSRKGYRNITVSCNYCHKDIITRAGDYNEHIKRKLKNFYCSRECSAFDKLGSKRSNTSLSLVRAYKEGRAKPNKYGKGGYRKDLNKYFRSMWEADIARVLNYLKIYWKYEPEVFTFKINKKETTYRPDFYLPNIDLWI